MPPHVELTDERERHIRLRHPDLLPENLPELIETLADPDLVLPNEFSKDKQAFVEWFSNLRGGKYVIVQVVSDPGEPDRHWIVTAYLDSVLTSIE